METRQLLSAYRCAAQTPAVRSDTADAPGKMSFTADSRRLWPSRPSFCGLTATRDRNRYTRIQLVLHTEVLKRVRPEYVEAAQLSSALKPERPTSDSFGAKQEEMLQEKSLSTTKFIILCNSLTEAKKKNGEEKSRRIKK